MLTLDSILDSLCDNRVVLLNQDAWAFETRWREAFGAGFHRKYGTLPLVHEQAI